MSLRAATAVRPVSRAVIEVPRFARHLGPIESFLIGSTVSAIVIGIVVWVADFSWMLIIVQACAMGLFIGLMCTCYSEHANCHAKVRRWSRGGDVIGCLCLLVLAIAGYNVWIKLLSDWPWDLLFCFFCGSSAFILLSIGGIVGLIRGFIALFLRR